MRVLLDECIPVRIADELPMHDVQTIRGMGWRGKKNGELLRLAASKFNVFVTIDKGLEFQQRIAHLPLGVVTLVSPSNDIDALRPLVPALRHAVMKVKPGQVIRVELA
jgi:predicted nuclease of predicted toxin-antitoxin system